MKMIKLFAAAPALMVALTAAVAVPGTALHAGNTKSATISYADLNLASETGREVLDQRIERAIDKVCGLTTRNIAMDASVRQCQRTTRADAHKSRDLAVADYANKRLANAGGKVIRLTAS